MTQDQQNYYARGYTHLKGLFPVEVLQAFFNRMQADLDATGRPLMSRGTRSPLFNDVAIEVYGYEYTPMLGFLWGLTPRMSEATGKDLLPTYAYFRIYQQGDVCLIHSDRESCEHSLSLTLGYSDGKPWALEVETERQQGLGQTIEQDFGGKDYGSVDMEPGDAVLYQGTHHRHGRLAPNPNAWSAHMFMHWVDRNGPYVEHAFDRPMLERQMRNG